MSELDSSSKLMAQQGRITKAQQVRAEQTGMRPGQLPEFDIQTQPFTEWVVQTWGPQFVKQGETIRFFVTLEPRFQRIAEKNLSLLWPKVLFRRSTRPARL